MPNPTDAQVAAVPIFSRMSPGDRARVASVSQVRAYRPGDVVFMEGDPTPELVTIVSGRVRLSTAGGRPDDLPDTLTAGDPLGDIGAVEGGPYPATGTAIEPTECLVIPRAELFRLLESPTLVRGLVHGLTHRIVQLTKELRQRP